MKFGEANLIGYVFKIIDSFSKKKESNIEQQSLIPNSNKEILFDLLSLNYIRTEIVSEKVGNINLRDKEDTLMSVKQILINYWKIKIKKEKRKRKGKKRRIKE